MGRIGYHLGGTAMMYRRRGGLFLGWPYLVDQHLDRAWFTSSGEGFLLSWVARVTAGTELTVYGYLNRFDQDGTALRAQPVEYSSSGKRYEFTFPQAVGGLRGPLQPLGAFPNPCSGSACVRFMASDVADARLDIFDTSGRLMVLR